MRNRFRVLAFDVAAPLAAIAGLVYIGIVFAWPLWWVAAVSALCLLIVEGVIVNIALARRDGVTVGTDDDAPGLRLVVVGLATAALVAAVVLGYTRWTVPDRNLREDRAEVAGIASSVAEASATFTPSSPTAAIDRAAALMTPDRADKYRNEFSSIAKQLTAKNVTATASTMSAGVEAIGPRDASVAVMMRGTQNVPGQPPDTAVLALRITLSKDGGRWLVDDVAPINSR
ncbi:hypothetical protein [Mycobacterium sp. 1274761.0]|uniref:hypothetical protein n=1 Tax=Mycobacterium sp. 1274761.0 TaxID=1834077 RepID=UPI0007FDF3E8|nr:hypothetical protein [Mycobacterium sp. 1274761.0]OBK71509.1 hypothetical protein A5651_18525 [Mycobacterium sp. 1274761.0]